MTENQCDTFLTLDYKLQSKEQLEHKPKSKAPRRQSKAYQKCIQSTNNETKVC